jgi:hypothetical protein
LANSAGWKLKPRNLIHLFAPFISGARFGTKSINKRKSDKKIRYKSIFLHVLISNLNIKKKRMKPTIKLNMCLVVNSLNEMLETIKIPKKAKKIDIVIVVKSKLSKLMFRS